jgi:hypothetical protein
VRIFGEKVKQTLIIISKNWDQLEEVKYDGEIIFLSQLTSKYNCIQWINKSHETIIQEKIEKVQNFQFIKVKNALRSLLPYNVIKNFDELNGERKKIANQLKECDPDRYFIQSLIMRKIGLSNVSLL